MNQNNQNNQNNRFDDVLLSKLALINELQVHQAELEAQNHELKEMQQLLEEARDRYTDLYDLAPVGYLTLDKAGIVQSINLTGSTMLYQQRSHIIGKPFLMYLHQHDSTKYLKYLHNVFQTSDITTLDLRVLNSSKTIKHFRLESSSIPDGNSCRIIMTDISELQDMSDKNKKLLAENRQLLQNVFNLQEKERRTLARELHDELGQWLTAIKAEAGIIANRCTESSSDIHQSTQAIEECANEMHAVIHNMLHRLRPALLDSLGLPDALLEMKDQWCSHHPEVELEFKLKGTLNQFNEHLNITTYRIVQEALNNICTHSDASKAQVSLSHPTRSEHTDLDCLLLHIEDNGKGFDTQTNSTGFGLLGMRERVIAAGGKLSIDSEPNAGMQIEIIMPVNNLLVLKRRAEDQLT